MRFLAAALLLASTLPAQDWARTKLDSSPRHHEYATLTANGKPLNAFISYPEVKSKATAIVMIPEIFGLSDWAKEMADELSASGYVVIAPDVLTGMGPNGGGTESFATRDAVTQAVSGLDPALVLAQLDAAADYVKTLPASSGTLAVAGFCWGGGKSFAFATHRHDLADAFVFYGPPPSAADMKQITTPVYGFYAGNDARIGATLPQATADTNPANKAAREKAYAKMTAILATAKPAPPMVKSGAGPHGMATLKQQKSTSSTQCHDAKATPGM